MTVLLVDREALYRWFVAESLHGWGVEVLSCGSMAEAETVLRGPVSPGLLIVDSEMLGGQGLEALRGMRDQAGAVPCLVLDAGGDLPRNVPGPVMVADKPVDSAAVVTLVTSQIRRHMPAA